MDANGLILKDEVYRIVGAAFEVLREVGHGLHEEPDENALAVEFQLLGIPIEQRRRFPVLYKDVQITEYVPGLIAFGTVIVDSKVIDRITDHERGQMMNHLRIAGLKAGVVLNFRRSNLEWERIILSEHSRPLASIRG